MARSSTSSPSSHSQPGKFSEELGEVGRAETGDGVPAFNGGETRCSATLISSRGDIIQSTGVRIESRVQEPKGFLAYGNTSIVQESDDSSNNRARGGCSKDAVPDASNGDDVVGSIGRDIRESTRRLGIVILRARIRRLVILEITLHRTLLIRRQREHITESTTTVNNLFAGALGLEDSRVGVHLGSAHTGDIRARPWETRVEASSIRARPIFARRGDDALA